MASAYKIVLVFGDASGKSVTFSYNDARPDVQASTIKNTMNRFITYGSIFKNVPVSIKDAYLIKTDKTVFNVSE